MNPNDIKKPMFQANQRHWTREKMLRAVDMLMIDPQALDPSDVRDLVWYQYVLINALEVAIETNQADEKTEGRFGCGVMFEFDPSATGLY